MVVLLHRWSSVLISMSHLSIEKILWKRNSSMYDSILVVYPTVAHRDDKHEHNVSVDWLARHRMQVGDDVEMDTRSSQLKSILFDRDNHTDGTLFDRSMYSSTVVERSQDVLVQLIFVHVSRRKNKSREEKRRADLFTWILLVIGIVINPDVAMLFLWMRKNDVKWTTNSSSGGGGSSRSSRSSTLLLLSSLPICLPSLIRTCPHTHTHTRTDTQPAMPMRVFSRQTRANT